MGCRFKKSINSKKDPLEINNFLTDLFIEIFLSIN